jgi:hypothetical protein
LYNCILLDQQETSVDFNYCSCRNHLRCTARKEKKTNNKQAMMTPTSCGLNSKHAKNNDNDKINTSSVASASASSDTTSGNVPRHHNHGHDYSYSQEETPTATNDDHVNDAATPTFTPHATPKRNSFSSSQQHQQQQDQTSSDSVAPPSSVGRGNSSSGGGSHGKSHHNYSAPHTPIASAKRPRNPYSSRRSTGATKNKVAHGNHAVAVENDRPMSISSKAWNLLGGGGGARRSYGGSPGSMTSTSVGANDVVINSYNHSGGSSMGRTDTGTGSGSGTGSTLEDIAPNDQEECMLSSVMSPVRKMKLVESSLSVNGAPMSPMHPVRPVTKYDKNVTMPDHTGIKISLYDGEKEEESITAGNTGPDRSSLVGTGNADPNTGMSHSSSPSVLKSIFSPVLNFLNHSSTKDAAATAVVAGTGGVAHGHKHRDKHIATKAVAAATTTTEATTQATTQATVLPAQATTQYNVGQKHTRDEVDPDGDVHMDGGDYLDAIVARSTPPSPVVDQHRIHHVEEQEDYGHFAATNPTVDSQQDEISVQDHEELDIEEEFNPYLFIKYLPPYETVVPNPRHKICLPPKDPSSPPISLVLDLDETLVHCTVEPISDADMTFPVVFNGLQYKVHVRLRPFLIDFLEAVHDKFEVIVFTASQEVYANELLNRIDPGECIFSVNHLVSSV